MYHFDFEQFVNEKREEYIKMVKEMFDSMENKKTYEQGLADAWEAARKIADLPYHKQPDVFGAGIHGYGAIIQHFTPAEVIAKIKAYEDKQNTFECGDVLKYKNDDECNKKFIYLYTDVVGSNVYANVIVYVKAIDAVACIVIPLELLEKTGEHINIVEVLKNE